MLATLGAALRGRAEGFEQRFFDSRSNLFAGLGVGGYLCVYIIYVGFPWWGMFFHAISGLESNRNRQFPFIPCNNVCIYVPGGLGRVRYLDRELRGVCGNNLVWNTHARENKKVACMCVFFGSVGCAILRRRLLCWLVK